MIISNSSVWFHVVMLLAKGLPIAVEAARVGHRTDLVSRAYWYNPFNRRAS